MIKKLTAFTLLFCFAMQAMAQEKPSLGPRPNLPGDLFIHVGKNLMFAAPEEMNDKLWGSFTTQIGYMYPIRIAESSFSFNPGIGFSWDRYAFNEGRTLAYANDDSLGVVLSVQRADSAYNFAAVRNSRFSTTYVEIPLEFRWYPLNKKVNTGGFYVALGGFVGYRLGAKNVINYTDQSGDKGAVFKEDWQIRQLRVGATFRVGIAGFGAFARYQLTPLFNAEQAPYFNNEDFNGRYNPAPFSFGLSFDIF